MSEEKLTPRELKFFKLIAENPEKPLSKLAREAGYAENSIRDGYIYTVAKRSDSTLRAALEKEGFTVEYIAKRVKEGSQAFETKVINRKKKESGTRGKKEFEYEIHKENLVDFPTRRGYVELGAKLRGDLVEKHEFTLPNIEKNTKLLEDLFRQARETREAGEKKTDDK